MRVHDVRMVKMVNGRGEWAGERPEHYVFGVPVGMIWVGCWALLAGLMVNAAHNIMNTAFRDLGYWSEFAVGSGLGLVIVVSLLLLNHQWERRARG